MKTLLTIQPELCERYVRAWRDDMDDWSWRLNRITEMPSIEAALRELRLSPLTPTGTDKRKLPHQQGPSDAVAGPVAIPLSGTMREMSVRARIATADTATDAGHPVAGDSDHGRLRLRLSLDLS